MKVFKLIFKNSLRRSLRTILTILGIALAVMAFGLIRTFIDAWYAGADAASPNRLVVRNAVSIVFTLPLAYRDQLLKIDGVKDVSYGVWFGGIYQDPKNFFAQFAIDQNNFFELYPEYIIAPDQLEAFKKDRRGAVVGRQTADRFGWKIGDQVTMIGTIYPGNWDFIIDGIYTGRDDITDETGFVFSYDYIDERMKEEMPGRVGQIGWFVLQIDDPGRAAEIGKMIDVRFANSWAETKTETEKEFTMSFIQMGSAIIFGMRIISFLIIGVILLVLANTMAMTARERISEHAFMRTLGFRGYHLVGLILGESLVIAVIGGAIGIGLLLLISPLIAIGISNFFPQFAPSDLTMILCILAALAVGFVSAIFPIQRALRISIVDGLRVVD